MMGKFRKSSHLEEERKELYRYSQILDELRRARLHFNSEELDHTKQFVKRQKEFKKLKFWLRLQDEIGKLSRETTSN